MTAVKLYSYKAYQRQNKVTDYVAGSGKAITFSKHHPFLLAVDHPDVSMSLQKVGGIENNEEIN